MGYPSNDTFIIFIHLYTLYTCSNIDMDEFRKLLTWPHEVAKPSASSPDEKEIESKVQTLYTCTCIYTMYMYVYNYTCTYTCIYTCTCTIIHVHTLYIYIYIYI